MEPMLIYISMQEKLERQSHFAAMSAYLEIPSHVKSRVNELALMVKLMLCYIASPVYIYKSPYYNFVFVSNHGNYAILIFILFCHNFLGIIIAGVLVGLVITFAIFNLCLVIVRLRR